MDHEGAKQELEQPIQRPALNTVTPDDIAAFERYAAEIAERLRIDRAAKPQAGRG